MTMASHPADASPIVWLNGQFLDHMRAGISPFDRGFLYGDGIFTTMRSQHGHILFLDDHLQRMGRSLGQINIPFDSRDDWSQVIRTLLIQNNLLEDIASVKMIVTRGVQRQPGIPRAVEPTVCILVQRYEPPSPEARQEGWRIHVCREGFAPPLAKYKSLNYLYFLAARQIAIDNGADDALILDCFGNVTETSIGSILARSDKGWWTPESICQLPGITLNRISRLLAQRGIPVKSKTADVEELCRADTIWILNSLMGIMPISQIDGKAVRDKAFQEAEFLLKELIECGKNP